MKLSERIKYAHLPFGRLAGLREIWVEEVAQLEAEIERLMRAVKWASGRFYRIGEKADSARMDNALRDKEKSSVAAEDSPEKESSQK